MVDDHDVPTPESACAGPGPGVPRRSPPPRTSTACRCPCACRHPEHITGEFTTIHEFGHQYSRACSASDEATPTVARRGHHLFSNTLLRRPVRRRRHDLADLATSSALGRSSYDPRRPLEQRRARRRRPPRRGLYRDFTGTFGGTVYRKTAAVSTPCARWSAPPKSDRAFRVYHDTWRFRHQTGADLGPAPARRGPEGRSGRAGPAGPAGRPRRPRLPGPGPRDHRLRRLRRGQDHQPAGRRRRRPAPRSGRRAGPDRAGGRARGRGAGRGQRGDRADRARGRVPPAGRARVRVHGRRARAAVVGRPGSLPRVHLPPGASWPASPSTPTTSSCSRASASTITCAPRPAQARRASATRSRASARPSTSPCSEASAW